MKWFFPCELQDFHSSISEKPADVLSKTSVDSRIHINTVRQSCSYDGDTSALLQKSSPDTLTVARRAWMSSFTGVASHRFEGLRAALSQDSRLGALMGSVWSEGRGGGDAPSPLWSHDQNPTGHLTSRSMNPLCITDNNMVMWAPRLHMCRCKTSQYIKTTVQSHIPKFKLYLKGSSHIFYTPHRGLETKLKFYGHLGRFGGHEVAVQGRAGGRKATVRCLTVRRAFKVPKIVWWSTEVRLTPPWPRAAVPLPPFNC